MIETLCWKNDKLYILDQRLLPGKVKYIRCKTYIDVARCIKDMAVRGAPAIGVAAAFGVALAGMEKKFEAIKTLAATRPTAVNLFWALERMRRLNGKFLLEEAKEIYRQDIEINRRIGSNGATLIKKGSNILTHCNAGALATAGYGTALGVIRSAFAQRKIKKVFVDETRPYLQGARLTAFELKAENIPYVLITDNMAGYFMNLGEIDAVVVGADRIAANGDTANKIGTYSLAVLAAHHKIPFYVAAPWSTVDLKIKNGGSIKIEERSSKEVTIINNKAIAPAGTLARHPAFDITPAKYISAIITEKGVFSEYKKNFYR